MATTVITISSGDSTAQAQQDLYTASSPKVTAQKLSQYFQSLACGAKAGSADVQVDGGASVAASGTLTITHANLSATDTVTVGGVVITARASGATGNEFNIGADATADATALKNLINSSASFTGICTATSALGVVTVTAAVKGTIGNAIGLAVSDATAVAVSAATLTGGVAITANSFSFGY